GLPTLLRHCRKGDRFHEVAYHLRGLAARLLAAPIAYADPDVIEQCCWCYDTRLVAGAATQALTEIVTENPPAEDRDPPSRTRGCSRRRTSLRPCAPGASPVAFLAPSGTSLGGPWRRMCGRCRRTVRRGGLSSPTATG